LQVAGYLFAGFADGRWKIVNVVLSPAVADRWQMADGTRDALTCSICHVSSSSAHVSMRVEPIEAKLEPLCSVAAPFTAEHQEKSANRIVFQIMSGGAFITPDSTLELEIPVIIPLFSTVSGTGKPIRDILRACFVFFTRGELVGGAVSAPTIASLKIRTVLPGLLLIEEGTVQRRRVGGRRSNFCFVGNGGLGFVGFIYFLVRR
jgi:hypothetical protein